MDLLYAIPIFIAGVILGPIVYAVDHWTRTKFLTWLYRYWKEIALVLCGVVVGAFCTSAFVKRDDPTEWKFG